MIRTRVDGIKFQKEFETEATKQGIYSARFYTLAGYSGVDNPADYLAVSGKSAFLVELKETKQASFSLYTMQQREKTDEVVEFIKLNPTTPLRYVLLIHFIAYNKYILLEIKEKIQPRGTVKAHYEPSYNSLQGAMAALKEI